MNFYSLKVKEIVQETPDAVSIIFTIPDNLLESFSFFPGQYVTVKATIDEKEVRRPYSINSIPGKDQLSITVKKVDKGVMSHFLCTLNAGTHLEISNPEGHFTVKPSHDKSRAHYFFAAGSGITPIMSMIQTILEEEPKSICYLLYGNRNEPNIIFYDALNSLCRKYADQLFVTHTLSNPTKEKVHGLGGWLGKKETLWKGMTGRISDKNIATFLEKNPTKYAEKLFYACGPGDMIQIVEKYLLAQNIETKNIHKEFFTPSNKGEIISTESVQEGQSNITVTLKGKEHQFDMPRKSIILDILVDKKLDPPYSCTNGACSTCIAKVTSGEVKMDACFALEQDEIDAGFILTCQSHPVTEEVVLTYDV
ncbi:MAG: 2Fe-2S iron-sulfur cluster-binding protein [Saprospiraceae bacterium]